MDVCVEGVEPLFSVVLLVFGFLNNVAKGLTR